MRHPAAAAPYHVPARPAVRPGCSRPRRAPRADAEVSLSCRLSILPPRRYRGTTLDVRSVSGQERTLEAPSRPHAKQKPRGFPRGFRVARLVYPAAPGRGFLFGGPVGTRATWRPSPVLLPWRLPVQVAPRDRRNRPARTARRLAVVSRSNPLAVVASPAPVQRSASAPVAASKPDGCVAPGDARPRPSAAVRVTDSRKYPRRATPCPRPPAWRFEADPPARGTFPHRGHSGLLSPGPSGRSPRSLANTVRAPHTFVQGSPAVPHGSWSLAVRVVSSPYSTGDGTSAVLEPPRGRSWMVRPTGLPPSTAREGTGLG